MRFSIKRQTFSIIQEMRIVFFILVVTQADQFSPRKAHYLNFLNLGQLASTFDWILSGIKVKLLLRWTTMFHPYIRENKTLNLSKQNYWRMSGQKCSDVCWWTKKIRLVEKMQNKETTKVILRWLYFNQ